VLYQLSYSHRRFHYSNRRLQLRFGNVRNLPASEVQFPNLPGPGYGLISNTVPPPYVPPKPVVP
jgi:hypothetical protein